MTIDMIVLIVFMHCGVKNDGKRISDASKKCSNQVIECLGYEVKKHPQVPVEVLLGKCQEEIPSVK
jgi:hypothetical protein